MYYIYICMFRNNEKNVLVLRYSFRMIIKIIYKIFYTKMLTNEIIYGAYLI